MLELIILMESCRILQYSASDSITIMTILLSYTIPSHNVKFWEKNKIYLKKTNRKYSVSFE